MLRILSRRFYSSKTVFQYFPKSFPNGNPSWLVDLKSLRKEYRELQAHEHPDANANAHTSRSSDINHAYQTVRQPLLRAQYLLLIKGGIDLNDEKMAQTIAQHDPGLLMKVLDVHEQLEGLSSEQEVKAISRENRERMAVIEQELTKAFEQNDMETAAQLTVELRYWTSLDRAVKEWEPGKAVNLNH